jgi:Lantibiotic biosynthesis dehydratase C-term
MRLDGMYTRMPSLQPVFPFESIVPVAVARVPPSWEKPVHHLAVNVYQWGDASQRRLLASCLGPVARALLQEGLAHRFWFTGFDARGPHVLAIFSTSGESVQPLRVRLCAELDVYLRENPSPDELPSGEVEARHRECRGKRLCALDAGEGFAQNNTYQICEQPGDGYPFRLSSGLATECELWDICGDLALWAIDQVRANTHTASSIWWTASLQYALARRSADGAEFWRYHATTLLSPGASLVMESEEKLPPLGAAIGLRNEALFTDMWEMVESGGGAPPSLDRLVWLATARGGNTHHERWALLREINHSVLSQLQQPVRARIPLVLYAWHRTYAGSLGPRPTNEAPVITPDSNC